MRSFALCLVQVSMRVDKAWADDLALAINNASVGVWGRDALPNLGDVLTFN